MYAASTAHRCLLLFLTAVVALHTAVVAEIGLLSLVCRKKGHKQLDCRCIGESSVVQMSRVCCRLGAPAFDSVAKVMLLLHVCCKEAGHILIVYCLGIAPTEDMCMMVP